VRIVATLLVGAVLAGGAGAASMPNGLYGVVTRGPITPVCKVGTPCSAPASGAVLVFLRKGHEQGRVRAQHDGSYRIALPAGTYAVRVLPARPLQPGAAWVRAAHFRHVDFSIDTGIR
jgi:hypothetical protein